MFVNVWHTLKQENQLDNSKYEDMTDYGIQYRYSLGGV